MSLFANSKNIFNYAAVLRRQGIKVDGRFLTRTRNIHFHHPPRPEGWFLDANRRRYIAAAGRIATGSGLGLILLALFPEFSGRHVNQLGAFVYGFLAPL